MMTPYSKMGAFGPNQQKEGTHATRGDGNGNFARKSPDINHRANQTAPPKQYKNKNTPKNEQGGYLTHRQIRQKQENATQAEAQHRRRTRKCDAKNEITDTKRTTKRKKTKTAHI